MNRTKKKRSRGGQISSRTPLARFAKEMGLSFRALSERTGIAESTLKKISCGDLSMTEKTAAVFATRFPGRVTKYFLLGLSKKMDVAEVGDRGTTEGYAPEVAERAAVHALEACAQEVNFDLLSKIISDDVATKLRRLKGNEADDFLKALDNVSFPQKSWVAKAIQNYPPGIYSEKDPIPEAMRDPWKIASELAGAWNRKQQSLKKTQQRRFADVFNDVLNRTLQSSDQKPRRDLVAAFEGILERAGRDPKSPLIATRILHFLFELEKEFNLV